MQEKTNTTSRQKHGGKKRSPERSENSYVIYNTCSKCPYNIYIDIVCNDNVQALIVSGEPDDEILQDARMSLISEFAQLSGNTQASALYSSMAKVQLYRNRLMGLGIAYHGLTAGFIEEVKPYLKYEGINTNVKEGDKVVIESVLRKIDTKIRKAKTDLKIELNRYENISKTDKGRRVTEQDFNAQHVAICSYFKFQIPKTISAAEYAAYLTQYKKALDHVNTK